MKKSVPISFYAMLAQFYIESNAFRLYIYKPFADSIEDPDFIAATSDFVKRENGWKVRYHKFDYDIAPFWFNSAAYHLKSGISFKAEYLTSKDCQLITSLVEQPDISYEEIGFIEEPWIEVREDGIIDYSFCNLVLKTAPARGDFQSLLAQMIRNHKAFVNKLDNKNKSRLFEVLYYSIR